MSRFSQLLHVLWNCQYHLIWVPKYRYRVLDGKVAYEVGKSLRVYAERQGCELVELNIQPDHVHLLINGFTKSIDFAIDGDAEGENGITDIQAVFVP